MKSVKGFENLGAPGIARRLEGASLGVADLVAKADRLRAAGGGLNAEEVAAARAVLPPLEGRVEQLERQMTQVFRRLSGAVPPVPPVADQDGPLPEGAVVRSEAKDRQARWREANREKIRERDRLRREAKKAMENK